MSETTNLKLFKHDNPSTNENQFDIEEALNENWDKLDIAYGNLNTNKVDKEEGKGLSTNDFTNELKTKLDSLENYDDTEIKQDISDIQKKDEQQDTEIENLKSENTELKAENERLRKDIDNNIPTTNGNGENITLEETTESRFTKFGIGGNSWQESRSGKNKFNIDYLNDTVENKNAETGSFEFKNCYGQAIMSATNLVKMLKPSTSYKCIANITLLEKPETLSNSYNYLINIYNYSASSTISILHTSTASDKDNWNVNETKKISCTFVTPSDLNGYTMLAYNHKDGDGNASGSFKFENIMILENTEEDESFEQYGAMPSTEFISEIRNCGDNVNLFDVAGTNFNESGKNNFTEKMSIGDTSVGASVYSDLANNSRCRAYYKVLANEIITISFNNEFTMTYVLEADNSGVIKKTEFNKSTSYTYAATEDTVLCLIFSKVDSTEFSNDDIGKLKNSIKIEKGSKATTYSKYGQGNANITVYNKNFVEGQWKVDFYNTDGAYSNNNLYRCFRKTLPAGTYKMSYNADIELFRRVNLTDGINVTFDSSSKLIMLTHTSEISFAFKKTDNTAWDLGENLSDIEFQIEAGTTATEFTEHKEQSFTFPLAEGQKMYKRDYLADDGIHHKRKQIELDGTGNWTKDDNENNTTDYFYLPATEVQALNMDLSKIKNFCCTHFGLSSDFRNIQGFSSTIVFIIAIQKEYTGITADDDKNTRITKFKNWLASQKTAGTPVVVEYELAEEEIEVYTEEQQAVYNEIKKTVHSYKDVTHIFSTDETSAIFNVEAKRDIQTQNDNLQSQIDEIKELLSTTATSALLLNNMQSDLESEVE